jgi:hypothetical protein
LVGIDERPFTVGVARGAWLIREAFVGCGTSIRGIDKSLLEVLVCRCAGTSPELLVLSLQLLDLAGRWRRL